MSTGRKPEHVSPGDLAPARTGTRSMRRYEVGIMGAWEHDLTGDPVFVANGPMPTVVEFWAEHDSSAPSSLRVFQVFGTGHPLPPDARYVGTCPRTADGLVWHLFELVGDETGASGEH